MAATINTNIGSLNAQRNLSMSQTALATAMQRLSSGLRINSAKDDAAGLAISERFSTQIRGLNQAVRNANDGISLSQTAEGALNTISDNLQRIRELAVQSANATNSSSDRAALDAEVQQRLAEVDRVAKQTNFNGQKILDGSFGQAAFQIGANVGQTINVDLATSMRTADLGAIATTTSTVDMNSLMGTGLYVGAGELTVQVGAATAVNVASGTYTSAADLADAINTAAGSDVATVSNGQLTIANTSTANSLTIGGADATTLGLNGTLAASTTATDSIAGTNFNNVELTGDLTVTLAGGSTQTITAGSYTASELATAINTAAAASKGSALVQAIASVDGGGALQLDNDEAAILTFAGAAATQLGLGAMAVEGAGGTETDSVAATVFNEAEIAGLSIAVDGGTAATITNGNYTQAELIQALNTAAGATVASDGGSGAVAITSTTSGAGQTIALTGADVTTFSLTSPLTSTVNSDVTTGTTLADQLAATTTFSLTAGQFTLTAGSTTVDITGDFTSAEDFADFLNTNFEGMNATVDATSGFISLNSSTSFTVGGDSTVLSNLGLTAGEVEATGDLTTVNVLTVDGANNAMQRIDAALTSVNNLRADFGAIQNRFESTISNLTTTAENLTASRSRIMDADFAQETAALSRAQILQQAGTAMVAQANQMPQGVLALLR